ncbi:MAG: STAS domain-containing protein [Bacteroidales bacterium]|nr:STAS domain-containing protein [Bacteroidales bacterium]
MLETTNINDILVVKLKDSHRLNALIAEPVKEALLEFFNKPNTSLVFDLEGITFIDSSGFGVFLSAMKAANNNYGQFKICNVNTDVMELFKLLQLHHVFEIYDELDPCLKSFNQ